MRNVEAQTVSLGMQHFENSVPDRVNTLGQRAAAPAELRLASADSFCYGYIGFMSALGAGYIYSIATPLAKAV